MKKSLWWLLALVLVVMLVLPAGLMGCKTADAVEETVCSGSRRGGSCRRSSCYS